MNGEAEQRVLDARLVPAALAVWGATAAGIVFGSGLAWCVAVASGIACAGLAVCVWRWGSTGWIPVLLVACVFGGAFSAVTAWRMADAEAHPLARAAASGGWVTAEVNPTEDPRATASSMGPGQVYFRASVRSVTVGNQHYDAGGAVTVRAPSGLWPETLPGQILTIRGKVSVPSRSDLTLAVITTEGGPLEIGGAPWYQRWAGVVRARFTEVCAQALAPDAAGLLPGLVLGDTSALSPVVKDNFTAAGLSHLTAVSGANIGILLGAVLLLVRAAALDPRAGAALAAVTILAFVIVARPSPSVLRAAVMGTIGLLSLVTGRRKQALPALSAAVIVLVIVMPELAVDWGFVLSTTATGALVILAPVWVDALRLRGWPRWLAEMTAVSGAAFAVTAPVVAAMAGTLSVVSIAANLLVAPVIGVLTVLGALVALLALVSAPAAGLLAVAVRPPVWWLLSVADRAAAVPGANLTVPSGLFGALVVLGLVLVSILLLWNRISRWLLGAVLTGLVLALAFHHVFSGGRLAPGWAMVMCDVGQGDGSVLATGDSRVVVIDVGPDPTSMDRCLNMLGVDDIALVLISHFHADHIAGLDAVLGGREVSAVGVGPMLLPESGFRDVDAAARAHGVPLVGLRAGSTFVLGTVQFDVLGPVLPVPRDVADADASANDQSLVLMAHTSAGRILLTGDAETAGDASIMRSGIDVRADVLKLPHHGSRTTSPAFLEAVRPRLTLVSAGAGNTFGHPHPQVMSELESLGGVVARTDQGGTLAVYGSVDGSVSVVSVPRGTIFG